MACYAKCMAAMLERPRTYSELADISGLDEKTIYRLVRALREQGCAYIGAWVRKSGKIVMAFSMGVGVDAPKPPALNQLQRNARRYAKEEQTVRPAGRHAIERDDNPLWQVRF